MKTTTITKIYITDAYVSSITWGHRKVNHNHLRLDKDYLKNLMEMDDKEAKREKQKNDFNLYPNED